MESKRKQATLLKMDKEADPQRFDLIGVVEFVVHESSDDASLSDGLVSQEDEFVLGKSRDRGHGSDLERKKAKMGDVAEPPI